MTGHSPKPLTVLVAEDEPAMLTLVARYMRRLGFNVIEASEGDTAWELAQEHTPDLVILDVMMPGMSGWEVCKRLKGQGPSGQFGDTGVIMLTGIGENLNEMTSSLFAADAWLNKPFQFPELDERVRQTLARYEKTERMPDPETLNGEVEDSPRLFSIPDEDFDEEESELDRQITARVLSRQPQQEPVRVGQSGLAKVSRSEKAAPAQAKAKSAPKAKKATPKKGAAAKRRSATKAKQPSVKRNVKKSAPKKSAPKKSAPKKSAPKKSAPKKGAPKKGAPKKSAAKKSAPKKGAPKKGAPKKSAAKKSAAKKSAAKKSAPKKSAPKKGAARKGAPKKRPPKKRPKGTARRGV